jgi:hypothetical protein
MENRRTSYPYVTAHSSIPAGAVGEVGEVGDSRSSPQRSDGLPITRKMDKTGARIEDPKSPTSPTSPIGRASEEGGAAAAGHPEDSPAAEDV